MTENLNTNTNTDLNTKNTKINIEDFQKIDLRMGQILSVEKVAEADKLLKLSVDLGPCVTESLEGEEEKRDIRQIVSGIALYFPDYSVLINKKCMFVANLEPRVIRGLKSDGMILAVASADGRFSLLVGETDVPVGARAK